ncbi:putative CtpA-like serine protease [Gimesia alba]|uniref:Putative CtpA-like serine protease n=1 Tax=Gimesia alba TaxID=2527973 RepID=A0A517RFG4_9PLAN|nr:S41 family peptidase [Gimesia alba]QDT42618.1 putative CtpA-like serine protease [Gimesia alba]
MFSSTKTLLLKRLQSKHLWVYLLGCSLALGSSVAYADPGALPIVIPVTQTQAIAKGEEYERTRQWIKAIEHYEESLKEWPDNDNIKYGLRRAKIHIGIDRRYMDSSFSKVLLSQSRREAFILFDEILSKIQSHFVDPLSTTSYVAHGTESLYLALANDQFIKAHLRGVPPEKIREVRRILRENYWNKSISSHHGAHQLINEVCDLSYRQLGLRDTAVISEYMFGGCNALDDYSSFLTPDRLGDLYDNIEGEFVGIGIEMKAEIGEGMLLINVLPDSPAEKGGVLAGDHIVSIDQKDCRNMTTDQAANLLRGTSGSLVVLELESPDSGKTRVARVTRKAVQVKSFPVVKMIDKENGIGYIKMTGFQKTSASELDAALRKLHGQGMRSLIWDVRGNPGGLLSAAVEVLDRFLEEGKLVSTKGRVADQNWSYTAHRPGTWKIPLVLLVDGNSASASEIVAGALTDHRRATVIGRKTYGKWSVQSIFPIRGSTGLRLTTAKFYSPQGNTYGKIGIKPSITVEKDELQTAMYGASQEQKLAADSDIKRGLQILQRQYAVAP